jgi:hypothetical protein
MRDVMDDLLRRFNGDIGEAAPGVVAGTEERLRAMILAERDALNSTERRRSWLPRWARIGVVPAIVAVSIAAAYATTRPATPSAGIQCFTQPSTTSSASVISVDGQSPESACATLWGQGKLDHSSTSVPSFVACDGGTGSIDVFPSSDAQLCDKLGLGPVPAGYSAEAQSFAPLENNLVSKFMASRCPDPKQARQWVQAELNRNGFTDWSIKDGEGVDGTGFSPERPCASLAFDSAEKVITLVPNTPDQ